MQLPGVEAVNDRRVTKFKERIAETLGRDEDLGVFRQLIEQYEQEQNVPAIEIAAALAKLVQGNAPFLLRPPERRERSFEPESSAPSSRRRPGPIGSSDRQSKMDSGLRRNDEELSSARRRGPSDFASQPSEKALGSRLRGSDENIRGNDERFGANDQGERPSRERKPARSGPATGFETFRIEVGHDHGVKPGNIVGAIANEAGLDAKHIGRVDIRDDHSFVDLPEGMPSDVFKLLKKVWVSGQQLRITRGGEGADVHKTNFPRKTFVQKPKKPGSFAKPAGFERPKRPKPHRPK